MARRPRDRVDGLVVGTPPGCGVVDPDLEECDGEPDVRVEHCTRCWGGRRLADEDNGGGFEMAKRAPGELPTAIEAKWARAEAEPGVPVELGDVVVCDLCSRDYRDDPIEGGLIFQSSAIGPCCEKQYRENVKRHGEERFVRAECPAGTSFWRFVLDYRERTGSTTIRVVQAGDLREALAQVRAGGAVVGAGEHPYGCRCDDCLTWWATMGPDGGEPGDYGPFSRDEVNARQRALGLEVTV